MFGQAVGPVFGGIISQYLGYHAIFWFLFGGAAFALLLVIVFLPETLRPIAGNGSTCLKGIHRPLYYRFKPSPEHLIERNLPARKKFTLSMIFTPFRLLLEKDVLAILASGSIVYAVWSMVTSSTTAIFQARFGLSDLQVGLVFLPNGVASMLGSYLTGRLSKHDFAVVERRYREQHGMHPDTPLRRSDLVDFPFARARLRSIWWLLAVFVTATALYGFSLDLKALAPPLILQFAISYAANSIFALNSTLVVDLFPRASASATAVNNLARCLVGAGGVAVVQVVVNAIGPGPAFAMWAGVAALAAAMLVLQWRNGARWAAERGERERRRTDVEKA
jgi:predicted MFS family arabinose efflux permease